MAVLWSPPSPLMCRLRYTQIPQHIMPLNGGRCRPKLCPPARAAAAAKNETRMMPPGIGWQCLRSAPVKRGPHLTTFLRARPLPFNSR